MSPKLISVPQLFGLMVRKTH